MEEDEALFFILISTHAPFVCSKPPTPFYRQMLRHLRQSVQQPEPKRRSNYDSLFYFYFSSFYHPPSIEIIVYYVMDHLSVDGGRRRGNKRSIPPLAFSRTWTQVIQLPNNIRDKKKKRHSNKHLAFLNPKFRSRFAFFPNRRTRLIGCNLPSCDKIIHFVFLLRQRKKPTNIFRLT